MVLKLPIKWTVVSKQTSDIVLFTFSYQAQVCARLQNIKSFQKGEGAWDESGQVTLY